jgi:hypothetical protein
LFYSIFTALSLHKYITYSQYNLSFFTAHTVHCLSSPQIRFCFCTRSRTRTRIASVVLLSSSPFAFVLTLRSRPCLHVSRPFGLVSRHQTYFKNSHFIIPTILLRAAHTL